jgi:hypothetical protein
MSQDTVKQRFDRVQLRGTKDDNSEVMVLTREAAALRCVELAAEGWSVEIVELGRPTPTEGRGGLGHGGRPAGSLRRASQSNASNDGACC